VGSAPAAECVGGTQPLQWCEKRAPNMEEYS